MKIEEAKTQHELQAKVNLIGNPIYQDVPISNNEDDNAIVATWGTVPEL